MRAKPILAFLLDPLGRGPRLISLTSDGISVIGGAINWVPFAAIQAAPVVKNGFPASALILPIEGAKSIRVRAVDLSTAQAFATAVEAAWRNYNVSQLQANADRITSLLSVIADLHSQKRYPAACLLRGTQQDASAFHHSVSSKLNATSIGEAEAARLAPINRFATEAKIMRAQAIAQFVDTELSRWKTFFDTVEAKPLTPEQRLSVVVDEEATLVLAGAGSGKTSVITAKAAYLIKAGIRTPSEILLLAFAHDAAKEMSERIEARCGMPVEARTFHALAYDIIGAVEGKKPALADHASDDMAFIALIKAILQDLLSATSDWPAPI